MFFSKELSVGNRAIDTEHKNLFSVIFWLYESIVAGQVGAMTEGFQMLDDLLHHYFEVEEAIAQAIDFDFTQHQISHQRLLDKIKYIRDELMAEKGERSGSELKKYADSLQNCLVRHIKEDGQPLKRVLDRQFYDFRPDKNQHQ